MNTDHTEAIEAIDKAFESVGVESIKDAFKANWKPSNKVALIIDEFNKQNLIFEACKIEQIEYEYEYKNATAWLLNNINNDQEMLLLIQSMLDSPTHLVCYRSWLMFFKTFENWEVIRK